MLNVKHEGEYDAELNIVFTKFINKALSFEDVDYIISEDERWYSSGKENRVWVITDVSEMGMASVKFVKDYQQKVKPLNEKYVIDYSVICSKPLEKIAVQLFNVLMREKHPVFKTREEAIDWVLKEQRKRGRFMPL
ncbi:MAG: hypothetical protein JRI53_01100 [Deltaproteobacteria bacterium]|nr:hypothetical protein [Deltaproteobacteria bacterium]MBW2180894.1 hypothetical protein [Deltaproteobacteria bacterium]